MEYTHECFIGFYTHTKKNGHDKNMAVSFAFNRRKLFLLCEDSKMLVKLLYASTCINNFLFTGEERMTNRTNINSDVMT